jgi:hypothetical protein
VHNLFFVWLKFYRLVQLLRRRFVIRLLATDREGCSGNERDESIILFSCPRASPEKFANAMGCYPTWRERGKTGDGPV